MRVSCFHSNQSLAVLVGPDSEEFVVLVHRAVPFEGWLCAPVRQLVKSVGAIVANTLSGALGEAISGNV